MKSDSKKAQELSYITGRRVLVTGGAGFLGRHVCEQLRVHRPSQLVVPRKADFDLRKIDQVQRLYETHKPQTVIHLAAVVGGIQANRENPAVYFYDNAMMCLQMMHHAYLSQVEKYVAVGTICSYPKFTPVPFKEADLWNGYPEETNAPYGLAKKMQIVQAQAYRSQYGFNAINILPVNLYGPHDNFDPNTSHVIPALIKKCIEARQRGDAAIDVWGTGKASREFLFVRDAAEGIVLATATYDGNEPVNLGSGREISIKDLVETIRDVARFEGAIHWDSNRPDGQPRRCLDTTKATETFGFRAKTRLADGLRETVTWYEEMIKKGMQAA